MQIADSLLLINSALQCLTLLLWLYCLTQTLYDAAMFDSTASCCCKVWLNCFVLQQCLTQLIHVAAMFDSNTLWCCNVWLKHFVMLQCLTQTLRIAEMFDSNTLWCWNVWLKHFVLLQCLTQLIRVAAMFDSNTSCCWNVWLKHFVLLECLAQTLRVAAMYDSNTLCCCNVWLKHFVLLECLTQTLCDAGMFDSTAKKAFDTKPDSLFVSFILLSFGMLSSSTFKSRKLINMLWKYRIEMLLYLASLYLILSLSIFFFFNKNYTLWTIYWTVGTNILMTNLIRIFIWYYKYIKITSIYTMLVYESAYLSNNSWLYYR